MMTLASLDETPESTLAIFHLPKKKKKAISCKEASPVELSHPA